MANLNHPDLQVFNADQLNHLHKEIDTPALLIVEERMDRNILNMQTLADQNYSWLRPHIKTHKSVDIAQRQMILGAPGITVAKLSEAEIMLNAGINDIFIANQITHPLKIDRLRNLHARGRIIIGIDHVQQIELLRPAFQNSLQPLEVRIEIDCGLHRSGVSSEQGLLDLARNIKKEPWMILEGIFTHAGHVYGASTPQEIVRIGEEEGEIMARYRKFLENNGIELQTVSVGSTPTVRYSARNDAVNEIRPGNYIFYDGIQMALGAARAEWCSLFVLASVVSQPAEDRIIIDAGSKALNLDRGAHGQSLIDGYGTVINHKAIIERLSEEHGIVRLLKAESVPLGSPVLILPNHACAVVNLYEKYHLISDRLDIEILTISARAKTQ